LRRGFVARLGLYSRINFKLNRAAALAEWRQPSAAKGQCYCPCRDGFASV